MKKKLSIAGLVLILIFCLAGCGSKSAEKEYDEERLQQYAQGIIDNFSKMSDKEFDQYRSMSDYNLDYTLMMTGFPIAGDDFRTMIDAWKSGQEDCGEFLEIGDFTTEVTNTGVVLSAPLKGEERDADLQFVFDENGQMESITVNAHYSTGEILKKAGLNTILGMGTVFIVLIFISLVIYCFNFIPGNEAPKQEAKPAPKPGPAKRPAQRPAVQPKENLVDDKELVAAITAAICAYTGTSSDGFVVRSIRRAEASTWKRA